MRKFATTIFAVLYGISLIAVSAERTSEWAARIAPLLARTDSGHSLSLGNQPETHPKLPKLIEPGFVVESPREAVAALTNSAPYTPLLYSEYHATWTTQTVSPRAPPFAI